MTKSIMEMVQELVLSQSEQRIMTADELDQLIVRTYQSLKRIQTMEIGGGSAENMNISGEEQAVTPSEPNGAQEEEQTLVTPVMPPSESIREDVIICLECGQEHKQLSHTHLRQHGLSPDEYRRKYGLPPKQPLTARSVSDRRKALAKERGTGEFLKAKRAESRSRQ
jgi:predicted transcriptional regulator